MYGSFHVLDVQKTGSRSVIGLKDNRISDESVMVRLFDEIDQFLRSGSCDVLVVDIGGIEVLPSAFIGRLVDLRRHVRVELLNASEYVGLVLETSKLTKLFAPPPDDSVAGSSTEQ